MKCELCSIEIEQPNVDSNVRDYLGNGFAAIKISFKCDRCNYVMASTTLTTQLVDTTIFVGREYYSDYSDVETKVILTSNNQSIWD